MIYRIEGVYNHQTVDKLQQLGVAHFGFDFRPTSFNFLQQHLFQAMADKLTGSDRIYLHFCGEKDFVIEKISREIPARGQTVLLEFSDSQDVDFYKQFGLPFIWHYRSFDHVEHLCKTPLFKGLVININLLAGLKDHRQIRAFAGQLPQTPIYLSCHWDSDLLPGFFEYLNISTISLPIDSSVEISYRRVDLNRFQNHFDKFQKLQL